MKKTNLLKSVISILLIISFLMSMCITGFATENNRSVNENNKTLSNEVLEKLNYGLDPEEWVTELPFEEDIEISDFESYIYEEPERFYADEMTEEEILEVIERIANGENVIFGDGTERDFSNFPEEESSSNSRSSKGESPTRWLGGDINKTHQWLAARGWQILKYDHSDVGDFFINSNYPIPEIMRGADWPDANEDNDLINRMYACHFFNPKDKKNYLGESSPTAQTKFTYWYNKAVTAYKNGDLNGTEGTYNYLGRAIHYLSDIGSPVHTGDKAVWYHDDDTQSLEVDLAVTGAIAIRHKLYETDADNVKSTYVINTNSRYGWFKNNNTNNIAQVNADVSYEYYGDAHSPNSTARQNAIKYPLMFTQQDVAGLLYKFYHDDV